MTRLDTHQHLLYPDRFSYEWTAAFPALAGAFTVEDYRMAAEGCDIAGSIFMEVDVPAEQAVAEAGFFCELAENPDSGIVGVIASGRPEEEGFAEHLEAIRHPRLCGIRRVLHTQPDGLSGTARFRENVARIGRAGLPFDLCALPGQAGKVMELVDACPGTRFVLDHCGIPPVASGDLSAWREGIREIARRGNVICKISGIIAYAAPDRIHAETFRPVVEQVIGSFGWERVVWGSDWPVCNLTSGLSTWTRLLEEILTGCSGDELARLYHRNACEVYGIRPPV